MGGAAVSRATFAGDSAGIGHAEVDQVAVIDVTSQMIVLVLRAALYAHDGGRDPEIIRRAVDHLTHINHERGGERCGHRYRSDPNDTDTMPTRSPASICLSAADNHGAPDVEPSVNV